MKNTFRYAVYYRICMLILCSVVAFLSGALCLIFTNGIIHPGDASVADIIAASFVALAAFICAISSLGYLIHVLTWKMSMTDEVLETTSWLARRKTIDRDDVFVVRFFMNWLKIEDLFDERHNMSISIFTSRMDELLDWAYQNEKMIFETDGFILERVDQTLFIPDSQSVFKKFIRSKIVCQYLVAITMPFLLLMAVVGHHAFYTAIPILSVPIAILGVAYYFNGLIAEGNNTESNMMIVLFLLSIIALICQVFLSIRIQTSEVLFPVAVIMGAAFYQMLSRANLAQRLNIHPLTFKICLMIFLPVYAYCFLREINCLTFLGKPQSVHTEITGKFSPEGQLIITAPSVDTYMWGEKFHLHTTAPLAREVKRGDSLVIRVYQGLFGIPWFKGSYNISNENEIARLSSDK